MTGTYDAGFHTALMAKDLRLYVEMVERSGTARDVGAAVSGSGNTPTRRCQAPTSPRSGSTSTGGGERIDKNQRGTCTSSRTASIVRARSTRDSPTTTSIARTSRTHRCTSSSSGPLLADDGETMIGSLFLTEADDKAEVEEFNRGDPFYEHGVWDQTIEIHAFLKRVDDRG